MSCNGCRVLRKGCSDTCILRPCLQWIDSSDAQGHATVFVAKFFGRAGLMGFISAVPDIQRPALFQSLLYEACGRTVNPVFGAVGLLWSGNWPICQAAVDTVLKGGSLLPSSPSSLSSSCLATNIRYSAPYSPPFDTSGNFSSHQSAKADDSSNLAEPLAATVLVGPSFDQHNMSLQFGLPEADVQEAKERLDGRNKIEIKGWDKNSAFGQNMRPCPDLHKDGQCDNWNTSAYITEPWKEYRGQQVYESNQRSVHLYGTHVAPRRVRARVEPFAMEALGSTHKSHEKGSAPASGFEQLELDLTLKVKGEKGEKMIGNKRFCSSCESVTSEGSVTSLDSTLREPTKLPNCSVEMGLMPPPFRKLLPLLQ